MVFDQSDFRAAELIKWQRHCTDLEQRLLQWLRCQREQVSSPSFERVGKIVGNRKINKRMVEPSGTSDSDIGFITFITHDLVIGLLYY